MSTAKSFKPPGSQTVVLSLTIKGALEALDFYQRAFGATEKYCLLGPDGKTVMHAEIRIAECVIMMSDEFPEWNCLSPLTVGGCPLTIRIYVEDVDAAFARAVAEGATSVEPVMDQFWGERSGKLRDPFGYFWSLGTLTEEVSDEEISRRFEKMMSKGAD